MMLESLSHLFHAHELQFLLLLCLWIIDFDYWDQGSVVEEMIVDQHLIRFQ